MTYKDLGYTGLLTRTILTVPKMSSLEARNSIPIGSLGADSIIPPMNATTDIVFSSTDNDTAAWTGGTIYFANGTDSGTMDAGNTGNISATTYVYYDREQLGSLQTTTNVANATGLNKLLVAIVEAGASGKDCKITPFIAAGLTVTGITADQIVAGTITADLIGAGEITAEKLAANSVTAIKIEAGAVTADKITADSLAAISATLGVVNVGGSVNGNGIINLYDGSGNLVIKTDNLGHHYYNTSAQELVKVDWLGLHGYNTSGTELMKFDGTGLKVYGDAGNVITMYASGGSQVRGQMGINATNDAYLGATNGAKLYLLSTSGETTLASGGDMLLDSGGDMFLETVGDFILNGTPKTAVVPTSKGYKALYCTESPEVWFMDFCESKDKIDPLFMEVTEPPYHYIKCENEEYQVWGKRKGMSNKRFEHKTKEEYSNNNEFWSIPHKHGLSK